MTIHPVPSRSLRTRLTLVYAAGIYLAGVVVLAVLTLPFIGIQSTAPGPAATPRPPAAITGTGQGIGPHQLLTGSAVALVVLAPVAVTGGWLVAGRFLKPLRAITTTAKAISAGNLDQRLALGEPVDELTELGHILDDLFARLEASFTAQRHFVANASHELRTPLAGLRTLLEVALGDPDADAATLRTACQEALALGEMQERLVTSLLALATSERGVTRRQPVDLSHVATGLLRSRRDQAAEKGIKLTEHLTPAVTAGDPRLIESLIANLVDNAIRHNHPAGQVQVTTELSGHAAAITVTNSGPVVPEDQLQRLLQPFQRLSADRNDHHNGHGHGHGLGLAIVNAVAQAHHATLTTTARPQGGLTITVHFAPSPQRASPQDALM